MLYQYNDVVYKIKNNIKWQYCYKNQKPTFNPELNVPKIKPRFECTRTNQEHLT